MAHVSVVKKLESCERIGNARQGEAATPLHADTYQLIKYKVKIKDYISTTNPACKLLHVIQSKAASSPSLPCSKLQLISLQSLHDHEVQNFLCPPLKLPLCTVQENDQEVSCTSSSSWKLQQCKIEQDRVVQRAASSAPVQPKTLYTREENPSSPCELQTDTKEETQQLVNEEDGRGGAGSPPRLQTEVQEKRPAGRGFRETVKKMECECCSMEEDCTEGYEERVRARLRGHWLCGLCEEAVGEEKKRVGGSVQAALVAHMQPCRGFSGRARSRVSPPSADMAVPRAVCRLLSRHLSTPSPHRPTSPTALCRSSSCIASLPKS